MRSHAGQVHLPFVCLKACMQQGKFDVLTAEKAPQRQTPTCSGRSSSCNSVAAALMAVDISSSSTSGMGTDGKTSPSRARNLHRQSIDFAGSWGRSPTRNSISAQSSTADCRCSGGFRQGGQVMPEWWLATKMNGCTRRLTTQTASPDIVIKGQLWQCGQPDSPQNQLHLAVGP